MNLLPLVVWAEADATRRCYGTCNGIGFKRRGARNLAARSVGPGRGLVVGAGLAAAEVVGELLPLGGANHATPAEGSFFLVVLQ